MGLDLAKAGLTFMTLLQSYILHTELNKNKQTSEHTLCKILSLLSMYNSPSFERPSLGQAQKWLHKASGLSMDVQ